MWKIKSLSNFLQTLFSKNLHQFWVRNWLTLTLSLSKILFNCLSIHLSLCLSICLSVCSFADSFLNLILCHLLFLLLCKHVKNIIKLHFISDVWKRTQAFALYPRPQLEVQVEPHLRVTTISERDRASFFLTQKLSGQTKSQFLFLIALCLGTKGSIPEQVKHAKINFNTGCTWHGMAKTCECLYKPTFFNLDRITVSKISFYNTDLFLHLQGFT